MRLEKIQKILKESGCPYTYTEEEGLGSIDFVYRGVSYYIWEFHDGEWGVETNLRSGGKSEDLVEEYEEKVAELLRYRLIS